MSTNHTRSKWAAVGAAVAVSLGAGGIGITQATTSSGEKPIYLPIEPCRLADTRTEFQVGSRSAPLGADETYTLSGQGAVGNCNLPAGTTALSLNVTAIDATAPTFVSLFPAGASLPVASHLNPLPGQGPVPNAVNVDLSGGGEFSIYNLAGNVNVFIDVVGVYDDHHHDDRYPQKDTVYTKAEVDERSVQVIVTEGRFFADFTFTPEAILFAGTANETVTTERDGYLDVSKFFSGRVACALNADARRIYFITVDGVAVQSSFVLARSEEVNVRLRGVTESPVPAGDHELGIAAECVGDNTPNAASGFAVTNASVLVIPAG
jgi:hypothetical protein